MLSFFAVIFNVSAKKQPNLNEQKEVNEFFTSQADWEGRYPPDFELELMDNTKFKLSEVIGTKLVVLNFFATWCGPCREEAPELSAYAGANHDAPFLLVAIDEDESPKTVQRFIDEFKISYPVGIDIDKEINKQYLVRGFPTTVVIGVDGTVKSYIVGPVANANVAFDHYLEEARQSIDNGEAITAEAYLDELEEQPTFPNSRVEEKPKDKLTGRAAEIAKEMLCPCGCSEMVEECTCGTSKNIKQALKSMKLEGRTDEEIIRELNAEFCVGNGKS